MTAVAEAAIDATARAEEDSPPHSEAPFFELMHKEDAKTGHSPGERHNPPNARFMCIQTILALTLGLLFFLMSVFFLASGYGIHYKTSQIRRWPVAEARVKRVFFNRSSSSLGSAFQNGSFRFADFLYTLIDPSAHPPYHLFIVPDIFYHIPVSRNIVLFVDYNYPADGRNWNPHKVTPFSDAYRNFFSDSPSAYQTRLADKYRNMKGQSVPIYINPDNPREAYLEVDAHAADFLLAAGLACLLAGIACGAFVFFHRKRVVARSNPSHCSCFCFMIQ